MRADLPKYPRTPYWPDSPSTAPGDRHVDDVGSFLGHELVLTEKLDGSNTLLYLGRAYGRSASPDNHDPWRAMVRKHHAWKLDDPDVLLYGEDIFAVHSIAYGPVAEDRTFYAFALRDGDRFMSWDRTVAFAEELDLPVVPVLHRGTFETRQELTDVLAVEHSRPSFLGGTREGIVMRRASDFHVFEFPNRVCKSVRANHVQTDQHWSRDWKPCALL